MPAFTSSNSCPNSSGADVCVASHAAWNTTYSAATSRSRPFVSEYVVFQDAWDAHHSSAPELFGQEFELVKAGNRYGLPPFYELHAWLWKHNPAGTFDDWNPNVTCP